mmetsp:Transcript_30649/g.58114  ORF Transcript_30649/g.58114 Transcript_30649/m.58114 type:complete len:282 (-) Transcript_30649:285-1130(-)|eukprot:CAMPEP_0201662496 /NCGR_PEP_ID=MMETSP0494-20130426/4574_1 /ASSEMBLY_ACC=CAM_ASM_000839 /TAXON_ID=420259 /ORGANISM="Thalassiosira gravida, Strain GMp14c1" /LENGTH=281 /DNA_ID=CAMNT_0048140877 /DNA_START=270 /DNA_END=1115 /DNA_ORIENTATION=-
MTTNKEHSVPVVANNAAKNNDEEEGGGGGGDPNTNPTTNNNNNDYPGNNNNKTTTPTFTEIGTNAVNDGLRRPKMQCLVHLKVLPIRWKLSVLVTLIAFVLSIIVLNSCHFISIERLYTTTNEEKETTTTITTTYFGRGIMQGQLHPNDECKPWTEYPNLEVGARMEAARVGAVGCVICGSLFVLLLVKDALFCSVFTSCFPTRMWRLFKILASLLGAAFQGLVQLLVASHFCKRDAGEGDDDYGGIYVQSCSTDTSSFGLSLAVTCLFLIDFVLVVSLRS